MDQSARTTIGDLGSRDCEYQWTPGHLTPWQNPGDHRSQTAIKSHSRLSRVKKHLDVNRHATVTTPTGRSTIAAKQPRRRPRVPSPSSPGSSPPPSEDDDEDDDEDRRRGLRRRLDLLNEDAQQRARGRRIRNITHTNTVTTVYEDGGGRPSVRRTSTRTSSPSPPRPPRRGRGRGRGQARGRGRRP